MEKDDITPPSNHDEAHDSDAAKEAATEHVAPTDAASSEYCELDGDLLPPGTLRCMVGQSGDFKLHRCENGHWIETPTGCAMEGSEFEEGDGDQGGSGP